MKRFLGIMMIGLLLTLPMQAQFDFGIKGGVNLAGSPTKISSVSDVTSTDNYTGFFVGPMVKFTMPVLNIGIEGDVLYYNSGVKINGKSVTKHSIEIPIYLRYDLSLPVVSKIVVPFIAVGPQFGFKISDEDLNLESAGDYDKYTFRSSTTSLNLGVGAKFFSHLQLHLNYNIPLGTTGELKDIPNAAEAVVGTIDSKTKTWQVSLAYIF